MSKVIDVTGHMWLRNDLIKIRNFREKHTNILALPGYRRLYRPKPKDVPDLELDGFPVWPISPAAVRCSPSARMAMLSKPKHMYRPKEEPTSPELHLVGPFQGGHYADVGALTAQCSDRVWQLSMPRKDVVLENKETFAHLFGKDFEERMDALFHANRTIFPPPELHTPPSVLQKKLKAIRTKKDWDDFYEWALTRALPKAVPKPRRLRKRKKVKLEVLMPRIKLLSTPTAGPEEEEFSPYEVRRAALYYKPSDRMKELAAHKIRAVDFGKTPGEVSKAARFYKMTPRMTALSAPIMRRKGPDGDFRENAFQVLPRALTAMCSPRTKKLAIPRKRQ